MEKSPAQGFNNRAGWKFRGYQISGAMGVGGVLIKMRELKIKNFIYSEC